MGFLVEIPTLGGGQFDKAEREEMVLPIRSMPTANLLVDDCNKASLPSLPLLFLPPFNSTLPWRPS